MTRWLKTYFLTLIMAWPAVAAERLAPIVVAPVKQDAIFQTVQLTGTVTSPRTATLSTSISGLVTAVHVNEGARVQANDLLLELDSDLARYQLQNLVAKVEQASITLQDAKRRLQEAQNLIPQKSIAKSAVRDLETEVAQAQAELQQSTSDMHYQQELLARHALQAPFTGVVSQKHTEIGEWVSPGNGVFELVATENVRVDFNVAEDYLAQIANETTVNFSLNVEPDTVYNGPIGAIVPVLNPTARTFLLRVLADPTYIHISPGMSAKALLQLPTGRSGIIVPKDALLRYPDGRVMVWIAEQKDDTWSVTERKVKTGVSFDRFIEIKEGLTSGERVVVRGNEALQNGQQVSLTSEVKS